MAKILLDIAERHWRYMPDVHRLACLPLTHLAILDPTGVGSLCDVEFDLVLLCNVLRAGGGSHGEILGHGVAGVAIWASMFVYGM